jgi:integrase
MLRALEVCSLVHTGSYAVSSDRRTRATGDLKFMIAKVMREKKFSLRKKSYQTYESQVRLFYKWIHKKNLTSVADFKKKHAIAFLEDLLSSGHVGTTVNNYKQNFRALFSKIKSAGVISENPFDGIKKYPEERKGSLYFKPEHVEKLRVVISEREAFLWQACQFIYYCFIRPGELRKIVVGDVYLDERKILIRESISKNKKSQFVSIPDSFVPVLTGMNLHEYPEDYFLIGPKGVPSQTPVGSRAFGVKHHNILRELNFRSGYTLYSWKHTGVVMAHQSGVNAKELKDQLRHHSLDMVDIYLKSMGLDDFHNIRKKFPGI